MSGPDADCFTVFGDRLVELALLPERIREVPVIVDNRRPEPDCLAEFGGGQAVLPHAEEGESVRMVGLGGAGFGPDLGTSDFHRRRQHRVGLVITTHILEEPAQPGEV